MSDGTTRAVAYAVIGSCGEYSDRVEWIAGVFLDKAQAIELATRKLQDAKTYHAAYDAWCRQAEYLGIEAPASPEMRSKAEEMIGRPMPTGDYADDYTVVQGPLGVWETWKEVNDVGSSRPERHEL